MPEPKIYLKCSAKERQTNYGPMLSISVKADDLIKFANEHKNDKGYLQLTVSQRREVGQYGDTHSVTLDTWKPKERGGAPRQQSAPTSRPVAPSAPGDQPPDDGSDPVPF